MIRALRVAAGGIGGGLMTAPSAAATTGTSSIGRARVVVLHTTTPGKSSAYSLNDWHLAILVALVLVLTGLTLGIRRSRVRKPIGWTGAALLVAACGVVMFLPAHSATSENIKLTGTEQSFLAAINEVREQHGVGPLASQGNLVRAARSHSDNMVAHDYFAHGVFWKRLEQFGVHGRNMGENLAWNSTPANAVNTLIQAWLASPDHRANLLSTRYSEIGVGIDIGPFEGYRQALVITTDFLGN
jgi:uncharacterized protein YkwD